MPSLNRELTVIHPARLAVRVGIHTGTVAVAPDMHGGTELFGEVLHVAARVQNLAEPDSVLVTAATNRLVAGRFAVADEGPVSSGASPLR